MSSVARTSGALTDDILSLGMHRRPSTHKLLLADVCTVMVHLYKWDLR